jgi:hypothetical protein
VFQIVQPLQARSHDSAHLLHLTHFLPLLHLFLQVRVCLCAPFFRLSASILGAPLLVGAVARSSFVAHPDTLAAARCCCCCRSFRLRRFIVLFAALILFFSTQRSRSIFSSTRLRLSSAKIEGAPAYRRRGRILPSAVARGSFLSFRLGVLPRMGPSGRRR